MSRTACRIRRWWGLLVHWLAFGTAFAVLPGCALLQFGEYARPVVRFDRPLNVALPDSETPQVREAIARWEGMTIEERERFPTAYHAFVDTPAPGAFEGEHVVGLAFSGGGSRGVVFAAACVAELRAMGPLALETAGGQRQVDLLGEVDYVSGVSTGSVPAALFALDRNGRCPDHLRVDRWPDALNLSVRDRALKTLAMRPDWWVRDYVADLNTHPLAAASLATTFFDGTRFDAASGLRFEDLPATPVLLIVSSIINDPGAPFVFTRLPYRYAIDETTPLPWMVGTQTFETFHSDPLAYPLGEACHNSLSYPGAMRAGLVKVWPEQPWVVAKLDEPEWGRMRRAQHQPFYEGFYMLKDGGLSDNRGAYTIGRLFEKLLNEGRIEGRPLLIGLDGGRLSLRMAEAGAGMLHESAMSEVAESLRTVYQFGQQAFDMVMVQAAETQAFDYVRLQYSDWVQYVTVEAYPGYDPIAAPAQRPPDYEEGAARLAELCNAEPAVGDPIRLLEIAFELGTHFHTLSPEEMAALRIAARFTLWKNRTALDTWALQTVTPGISPSGSG